MQRRRIRRSAKSRGACESDLDVARSRERCCTSDNVIEGCSLQQVLMDFGNAGGLAISRQGSLLFQAFR